MRLKDTLRILISLSLTALPFFASAQEAASNEELEELQVFQMTGSKISRAEFEGAFSTDLYTAADIDRTPYQTVNNFLRTVPATYGADNVDDSFVNGGDGGAYIGLRGLPTLTLVNGRRTATGDTNLIPLMMVDRIEILKEGNGAVYGADAVGGVVNIVTKKDFEGMETTIGYNDTEDGDWGQFTAGAIYGATSDKGFVLAGINYFKSNSIMSSDRDHITNTSSLTAIATSSTPNPGRYTLPAGSWGPAGDYRVDNDVTVASGISDMRKGDYSSDNADRFPYALYTPAYRPSERKAIFGSGEYELLGDNMTFYADFIYNNATSEAGLAPSPTAPGLQIGATIPADNYWNQQVFGAEAADITRWSYRFLDLGPRLNEVQMDDLFILGGLKGDITENWQYDVSYFYNEHERLDSEKNGVNLTNLKEVIDNSNDPTYEFSGAKSFNPFTNPFDSGVVSNDPDMLNYISILLTTERIYKEELANITITGQPLELPAGVVDVAFGVEERDAGFKRTPDYAKEFLAPGSGWNGTTKEDWTYKTTSVFGEVIAPIISGKDFIKNFEIGAAVRREDFSHISAAPTIWRYFTRYQMNDELTFRASYSEGFTTPTPSDLTDETYQSFPNLFMPWLNLLDQSKQGVIIAGNTDLLPTESETINVGLVYAPKAVKGLEVIVDYYKVDQSNIVTSSAQYYVDVWYADNGISKNSAGTWVKNPSATFSDRITIDPLDGYILQIDPVETLNLATRALQGIDLEVRYLMNTDSIGDFNFRFSGTHILEFEQENVPGTVTDYKGFFTPNDDLGPETVPEYRWFLAIDWMFENWTANFTWNHVGSYSEDPTGGTNYTAKIASWDTFDFGVGYTIESTGTSIRVGVQNLLAEDPPIARSSFADNYDRSAHNILGRVYSIRVNQSF